MQKGEDRCQKFNSLVLKDPEVQETFPRLEDLDWASLDSPPPPVPERTSMPCQGPRPERRDGPGFGGHRGPGSSPREIDFTTPQLPYRNTLRYEERSKRENFLIVVPFQTIACQQFVSEVLKTPKVEETFPRLEELNWTLLDSNPEPERTSMPGQGPRPERRDGPGDRFGGHWAPGSPTTGNYYNIVMSSRPLEVLRAQPTLVRPYDPTLPGEQEQEVMRGRRKLQVLLPSLISEEEEDEDH
ncbi:unnamed protein product [Boreogadus saida]